MKLDTAKSIGDFGERKAVSYLRRHGYRICARNYRAGKYEIDVIATNWTDIVFVEVKSRTYQGTEASYAPPPKNAVHAQKQQFTRRAAQQYLHENPTKKRPRMDVIQVWLSPAIEGGKPKLLKIEHLKAA
ncbi:MAG: YraN family protein, partial [Clostridia bacterium]|nr:YraN family protein [Clostridia bacterium]